MEHNLENLALERDLLLADKKILLEEKQGLQRTLEEAEKVTMELSEANEIAQLQYEELTSKYTELEKKLAARETTIEELENQRSGLYNDLLDCESERDRIREDLRLGQRTNELLQAQLRMVYLIFGGERPKPNRLLRPTVYGFGRKRGENHDS